MTTTVPGAGRRPGALAAHDDDSSWTQQWQRLQQQQQQQQQQQAPEDGHPCQPNWKRGRDGDTVSVIDQQDQRQAKRCRYHIGQVYASRDPEEKGRQAKRPWLSSDGQVEENQEDGQDRSNKPTSKGRRWTEQELRHVIAKAIQYPFPGISAIHPTASVIANTIAIPSVPVHIFETLHHLLRLSPVTTAWKAEFRHRSNFVTRSRGREGRLTITMPTRVHEEFIPFSNDIADQLFNAHFLPPQYKRKEIKQSGSTKVPIASGTFTPDAGISFFTSRNTFLVLEVAYSQKEEDAQRKAQSYILDTNGNITFVVLVIVTKGPRKKTTDSKGPVATPLKDDNLSLDCDTVHVHVYKSVKRPPATLTGEHVINRVQVFPGPAPNNTFKITWSDINSGTWSDFCAGARLPPNVPEPTCDINFYALVSIAQSLAGQADGSREGTPLYRPELLSHVETPILNKERFIASSSPAAHLSSGGTVLSDEGRRFDPDYEPSIGSNESSD